MRLKSRILKCKNWFKREVHFLVQGLKMKRKLMRIQLMKLMKRQQILQMKLKRLTKILKMKQRSLIKSFKRKQIKIKFLRLKKRSYKNVTNLYKKCLKELQKSKNYRLLLSTLINSLRICTHILRISLAWQRKMMMLFCLRNLQEVLAVLLARKELRTYPCKPTLESSTHGTRCHKESLLLRLDKVSLKYCK